MELENANNRAAALWDVAKRLARQLRRVANLHQVAEEWASYHAAQESTFVGMADEATARAEKAEALLNADADDLGFRRLVQETIAHRSAQSGR
ncbi:hypothetical protein [Saccharopolyspora shandongensis]|uniref:hypothetical protein n=1 Tax=Saccharopolyspora shandongensis TaxID=418495 RepID=UPI0033FBC982